MIITDHAKTPWRVRTLRVSAELAGELDAIIISGQGGRRNP
jgi:hypothetical protein